MTINPLFIAWQLISDCLRKDVFRKDQADSLVFKECPICAAKPGTPILCASCLHNRYVIEKLKGGRE